MIDVMRGKRCQVFCRRDSLRLGYVRRKIIPGSGGSQQVLLQDLMQVLGNIPEKMSGKRERMSTIRVFFFYF